MFLRRFTAVFLFLVLIVPGAGARAQDSVFTVRGVRVDITADSAVVAREKAFTQAGQDAFRQLAERLLPDADMDKFELPPPETVSALVNDFEITDEHLSRVEYIGTYTFRFKGDAVRAWLGGQGLRYSDVSSKPVLILPFYQWGSKTMLWGEGNPWMAAWARNETWQGLVPATVPIGDLQDTADIGDNDALTYDAQKLQDLLMRYDTGEAVIMLCTPLWSGTPAPDAVPDELGVMIYRTDRAGPEYAQSIKVQKQEDETADALFDRAVKESRELLQSNWKSRTAAASEEKNNLDVRVRFTNMQEWVETQKALRNVQGVSNIKLVSLKPGQALVRMLFRGSEDRLRLALAQADMTLTTPQVSFTGGNSPLVYDLYLNRYAHSGPY